LLYAGEGQTPVTTSHFFLYGETPLAIGQWSRLRTRDYALRTRQRP